MHSTNAKFLEESLPETCFVRKNPSYIFSLVETKCFIIACDSFSDIAVTLQLRDELVARPAVTSLPPGVGWVQLAAGASALLERFGGGDCDLLWRHDMLKDNSSS